MLKFQRSPEHTINLLAQADRLPMMSPELLEAALYQAADETTPEPLDKAWDFFAAKAIFVPEGLEWIPGAWLTQLPSVLWAIRKPHWTHLPYMIRALNLRNGVLCFTFAQELPNREDRVTAWDRLRVEVNCRLYPNLWSALPHRLEKMVWDARPDLRTELFKVLG